MQIYVYWNRTNNDCKKIFHFFSPSDALSIVEKLNENNVADIGRITAKYKDAGKIYEKITNCDVAIFCTHGSKSEILKYRNDDKMDEGSYVLIDESNINILNDKVVLAFCCSSARILGKLSVEAPNKCRAYVGFEKDILYYLRGKRNANQTKHVAFQAYKAAFSNALQYAIRTKCTVEKFRSKLVYYLRRESFKAAMESCNNSLNDIFAGAIDNVVAHGDQSTVIFD